MPKNQKELNTRQGGQGECCSDGRCSSTKATVPDPLDRVQTVWKINMKTTYLAACLLGLPLALNTSFGAQGNNEITVNGYSDIITFDKPVAYYRFEETTGDKTKNFGTGGAADDGLWKVGTGP